MIARVAALLPQVQALPDRDGPPHGLIASLGGPYTWGKDRPQLSPTRRRGPSWPRVTDRGNLRAATRPANLAWAAPTREERTGRNPHPRVGAAHRGRASSTDEILRAATRPESRPGRPLHVGERRNGAPRPPLRAFVPSWLIVTRPSAERRQRRAPGQDIQSPRLHRISCRSLQRCPHARPDDGLSAHHSRHPAASRNAVRPTGDRHPPHRPQPAPLHLGRRCGARPPPRRRPPPARRRAGRPGRHPVLEPRAAPGDLLRRAARRRRPAHAEPAAAARGSRLHREPRRRPRPAGRRRPAAALRADQGAHQRRQGHRRAAPTAA